MYIFRFIVGYYYPQKCKVYPQSYYKAQGGSKNGRGFGISSWGSEGVRAGYPDPSVITLVAEWIHFTLFRIILPTIKRQVFGRTLC